MIKRTESKTTSKRRKKRSNSKRRMMMMESLEQRNLLAGDVELPIFDIPRNIGAVQATAVSESEVAGATGQNDSFLNADIINLGTLPTNDDTIDLTGTLGITIDSRGNTRTDVDVFGFDLRAGDILDIALQGAASSISVFDENGQFWFGTDFNIGELTGPENSPLQTVGNAVIAQVVPEDGRYYLFVAPSDFGSNYTAGLRTYRPVLEQLPIGSQQIVFLDFDGGIFPTSVFTPQLPPGVIRFPALEEDLDLLGLDDVSPQVVNELISDTVAEVEAQFARLGLGNFNGDFANTGNPGDFGVTILNSLEDPDPGFDNPLVTRILVGGTAADTGVPTVGLAQSIDVGNFDTSELGFVLVDLLVNQVTQVPISNSQSINDAVSVFLASVITHEVGHTIGLFHTENSNDTPGIQDAGGALQSLQGLLGVGNDGIFGSFDDEPPVFTTDEFELNELPILGNQFSAQSAAFALSSGTVGGSISGRVFNDTNGDGNGAADAGLAGVTIFADTNNNGIQDPSDSTTVTSADGTFVLGAAAGNFTVFAIAPENFAATTPQQQAVAVSLNGIASGVEFGFTQVNPDVTGTKFADLNGNGFLDAGEPGLGGVFIYVDLDGDDRPDLGEPGALTNPDGSYSINFPGPGVFTIREVVEPGFIQTFPGPAAGFEHTVFFDGTALTNNFNFGNLPSQDFGDAPDSFLTSEAVGGPSHGLTDGLSLGSIVDRELDGLPSFDAQGDDTNGLINFDGTTQDDEDGVRLLSPIGPGDSASFEVSVTNTTGSPGFLQAWFDFNLDGDFTDPGEQIVTDLQLATGVHTVSFDTPADAVVGSSFARFRYSQTAGLGVGGAADTGEVEDYSFPILGAAEIANNDTFTVSRNSLSNQLNVLANDFQTLDNQLSVVSLNVNGTNGTVVVAADGNSVFYTPQNGFIGLDTFAYTVSNEFGQLSTAVVTVNVTFQSANPIAVDDSFEVPEGSVNRPLNVLDNDVPSLAGGLTITSVTAGNQGGTVTIIGGGQSLRYTPLPGFNGTEQFTYSVQDSAGSVSTATVTLNLLPGSQNDDIVDFSIGIFDVVNNTEITNVQVGDVFNVRVFVDDLRDVTFGPEGVASAFLDLLFTDELVATVNSGNPSGFPFDITFGPLFDGAGSFQAGSSFTPGLLDDVGGVQSVLNPIEHQGPVELFTVTLQAVSPGVALFQADPADNQVSETVIIGQDVELPVNALRLGNAELLISPSGDDFPSAIDDSFPDGLDSNGNLIIGGTSANRLDVLANDNFEPTNVVTEFGLVTAPAFGTATINDNNTPTNFNDDFIEYFANTNSNGFEQFTYVIVTADGVRSTAEVTIALGNAGSDDLVAIDFALVDANGLPTTTVAQGEQFGVQVLVEDLRTAFGGQTFVFAGFLDILFDSGAITPTNTNTADDFDFDVVFDSDFNTPAAVGTAVRPGLIDEFGSLLIQTVTDTGTLNPNLMATIFFTANSIGTTTIVGGPADNLPFQDTLLFGSDDPVPVSQIRFDRLDITVTAPTTPPAPAAFLQNQANPADVNADGLVSPIDALLIMNRLGATTLAEGEQVGGSTLFLDTNGSGSLTALDALFVINRLTSSNRQALTAEGEFVSATLATADSNSQPVAADAVFATLNQRQLLGDQNSDAGSSNQQALEINVDTDSNDEEEDVLNLIADDLVDLLG